MVLYPSYVSSESEISIMHLLLAMLNPLHSKMNQEFKKHLCNQSSYYEKNQTISIPLREPSHGTTKLTLFTVKDEWNTK